MPNKILLSALQTAGIDYYKASIIAETIGEDMGKQYDKSVKFWQNMYLGAKVDTTAIILNYNGEAWLHDLLKALEQELCKILIVDNRSTDLSAEVATESGVEHDWWQMGKNKGFALGNNKGAELADTEYLLFINNDTLPREGFLKWMRAAVCDKHPIIGAKLIYGETKHKRLNRIDLHTTEGEVQHAGIHYTADYMPYEYGRGMSPDDERVNEPSEAPSITAACMLIKRSVFKELGGFDKLFINGWEDTDLCLRALEKGHRCWYEPRAEVVHYCSTAKGRFKHESKNKSHWLKRWVNGKRIDKIL